MAELTPEGQAARRAALIAKRRRKRLRSSERKAAEKELETANSEQLRRSEGTSLHVPKKSGVFPKDLEAAVRDVKLESQKGRPKRLTGVKTLPPRTNRMLCTPERSKERGSPD